MTKYGISKIYISRFSRCHLRGMQASRLSALQVELKSHSVSHCILKCMAGLNHTTLKSVVVGLNPTHSNMWHSLGDCSDIYYLPCAIFDPYIGIYRVEYTV